MSMKQSLGLNLGQTLTMTPALQQAIRMLQLSTLDLKTEIQEALETNVMLEADDGTQEVDAKTRQAEPDASGGDSPDIPENLPVDADWNDIYASAPAPTSSAPASDDEDYWAYRQANLSSTPDLATHLVWQADMAGFSPAERAAAEIIIDAIDGNGLIDDWDELATTVARDTTLDHAETEAVLAAIQAFDPPGVAARSLGECLQIQWAGLDSGLPGHALAGRLLSDEWLAVRAPGGPPALAGPPGVDAAPLGGPPRGGGAPTPPPGGGF